jgi:hypothetical protein
LSESLTVSPATATNAVTRSADVVASVKPIKKKLIEEYIVCLIRDLLFDDKLIDRLADTLEKVQESEDVIIPVLRQELAEAEKKIENVFDAIDKGVLAPSTKERLEAHEARRDELKANIAAEENCHPI